MTDREMDLMWGDAPETEKEAIWLEARQKFIDELLTTFFKKPLESDEWQEGDMDWEEIL